MSPIPHDGPNGSDGPSGRPEPLVVDSRNVNPQKNPNLKSVHSVMLKDGPRCRKSAKFLTIRNQHNGEVHHHALQIETEMMSKVGWVPDDKHSIGLSTEEGDEIQKLVDFIALNRGGGPLADGRYVVFPARGNDADALAQVVEDADANGKIDVLSAVLNRAIESPELFQVLLDRVRANPKAFVEAAAALKVAAYQKAISDLETLIATPGTRESAYQCLLEENPWMFGSEYSELLDRRRWTRDENQDFVLRRTADSFIEVIEIKTPLDRRPMFSFDRSHNTYYAGNDLSRVLGQVQNYLEKLDADRDRIRANDKEDTLKIRAKIIIGMDVDGEQKLALRRLNGHLYRIEVMTFDQLLRIAKRVVSYLEGIMWPGELTEPKPGPEPWDDDDIPF
jgi:hypothetical protein